MSYVALQLPSVITPDLDFHHIRHYQLFTLFTSSTTAAGRNSFSRRSVLQIMHNKDGWVMYVLLPYAYSFLTFE